MNLPSNLPVFEREGDAAQWLVGEGKAWLLDSLECARLWRAQQWEASRQREAIP